MDEYSKAKDRFIGGLNKNPASLLSIMYEKYGRIVECNDGKATAIGREYKSLESTF